MTGGGIDRARLVRAEQLPSRIRARFCMCFLVMAGITPGAWCARGENQAARWSTVKSESLTVYSGMSFTSAIVKSLKRGDRVSVELDLTSGSEHWCQVREAGEIKPAGFVPCEDLDRPPAPPPRWRTELPVAPGAGPEQKDDSQEKSRPARTISTREFHRLLLNQFNPEFWQDRLDFTPSQREDARSLAASTGTEYCVGKIAKVFRVYQIFDLMSLAFAGGGSREFGVEVEGNVAQCLPSFKKFWKQFPSLMTREQFERFQAERRSAGRRSTGIEGGLVMYALYRANRA